MASTSTVSYQFRNQLELLIQTLTVTAPHYIKCIKPNRFKQALDFDKCAHIGIDIDIEAHNLQPPMQTFYSLA